jgi:hypothetical protein
MHYIQRQNFQKFKEYSFVEPKLKDLYLEIKNLTDQDIKEYGLITKMWLEKYKPQLVKIVGRQRPVKDELSADEVYKIAYDTLFDALPYGNIDEEYYDEELEEELEYKSWYVHYLNF